MFKIVEILAIFLKKTIDIQQKNVIIDDGILRKNQKTMKKALNLW